MRDLTIVPVIHSAAELGAAAPAVERALQDLSESEARRRARVIGDMWSEIARWANDLDGPFETLHLYQDGLPVCDHTDAIVRDLAEQGSPNHAILRTLVSRGATLWGTESPTLLLAEYRLVRGETPTGRSPEAEAKRLLVERDRFIAKRIDETLPEGHRGVVFIGLLHDLERHLDPGIRPHHPFDWARQPPEQRASP